MDYLRNHTRKILTRAGYTVTAASCGKDGLQSLRNTDFDLVLLDLDLGDIDGTEIIALLRRQNIETPIIVISNFDQIDSKVNAFNIGCDDYITKPFYREELLARIRRMQKRVMLNQAEKKISAQSTVTIGPFQIDYQNLSVSKNGHSLVLNKKLFDIFSFFITNMGQVITKEQLLTRFWWDKESPSENTLSVHIHMLRELIEDDPKHPVYLSTKRGQGYIFLNKKNDVV